MQGKIDGMDAQCFRLLPYFFQIPDHLFRRHPGTEAVGATHDQQVFQMEGAHIPVEPFHHHGAGISAFRLSGSRIPGIGIDMIQQQ